MVVYPGVVSDQKRRLKRFRLVGECLPVKRPCPFDLHDIAGEDEGSIDGLSHLPVGDGGRAAEGVEPFLGALGGVVAASFGP